MICSMMPFMSATEPIRNKQALNDFKNYYVHVEPNLRNYALIVVGLNTALRINDLLHLKWDEIFWNGEIKEQGTHEQLIGANGIYKELYSLQFRDEE